MALRFLFSGFAGVAIAAAGIAIGQPAQAGVIYSPVGGIVIAGGSDPAAGNSITNTFDQSGLANPPDFAFQSGVTNFSTYLADVPQHQVNSEFEWFSATDNFYKLIYDLGSPKTISALALWNEDSKGIPSLTVSFATSGSISSLANALAISFANPHSFTPAVPGTSGGGQIYEVEIFSFAPINARFVLFDMQGCSANLGCAIGEVAFDAALSPVPLPAAMPLFASGLGLLGLLGWRRKRKAQMIA